MAAGDAKSGLLLKRLSQQIDVFEDSPPSKRDVPVIANVDARPRTTAAGAIEALIAQISSPVRWEESVKYLAAAGVTTYIEVGPGTVLSGLVRKIHGDATVLNVQAPADLGAVPLAS